MSSDKIGTLALRDSYLKSARQPAAQNLIQVNYDFIQLIQHAATNSSYWRERLPSQLVNQGPESITENLSLFPITSRLALQESFEESQIHIPNSIVADYWTAATSGSTGYPVRILKYLPTYLTEYDAITLLEWRWFRRDVRKTIVKVRIGGSVVKRVTWSAPLNFIGEPTVGYEITYDGNKTKELLNLIEKMEPSYLYGAPSTLTNLSHELLAANRSMPKVEQILTAGESLQLWQRELFAAAFPGVVIVDRYSSEEFGYLALQCPNANHQHVITPNVYLEILNENNQPCEIGEVGKVVVTGLHTFAQPLIRYEIGDLASWGEPTNCGITWPVLGEIVGRTHEFKKLPDGSTRRITFARSKFIENSKLRDYQVFLFEDAIVALLSVVTPLDKTEQEIVKTELLERIKIELPVVIRETNVLPLFKKLKRNSVELIEHNYDQNYSDLDLIKLVEPSE